MPVDEMNKKTEKVISMNSPFLLDYIIVYRKVMSQGGLYLGISLDNLRPAISVLGTSKAY